MRRTIARSGRGLGLGCWQRDDAGQALQQKFQLVFVQSFIALSAEVMADVVVELLTEQPVLGLQPGVIRLQRDDTRTQLIYLLKQRGVGVHQLGLIDTRRRKKVSVKQNIFQKYFSGDTSSFSSALPTHESVR
jgi:hypothetical protein